MTPLMVRGSTFGGADMRAVVIAALAAAFLGGQQAGGLPEASGDDRPSDSRPEDWRQRQCRFQSLQAGTWTAREERLTAECAVSRWSVPGGLSKFSAVAACESGWNRLASNGGSYLGLFQHAAPYWPSRVHSLMPKGWRIGPWTRWSNSRAQIVVTARMVHGGGWGPWSCA